MYNKSIKIFPIFILALMLSGCSSTYFKKNNVIMNNKQDTHQASQNNNIQNQVVPTQENAIDVKNDPVANDSNSKVVSKKQINQESINIKWVKDEPVDSLGIVDCDQYNKDDSSCKILSDNFSKVGEVLDGQFKGVDVISEIVKTKQDKNVNVNGKYINISFNINYFLLYIKKDKDIIRLDNYSDYYNINNSGLVVDDGKFIFTNNITIKNYKIYKNRSMISSSKTENIDITWQNSEEIHDAIIMDGYEKDYGNDAEMVDNYVYNNSDYNHLSSAYKENINSGFNYPISKYYKIGTVKSGKYKDGEFILMKINPASGIGDVDSYYRIIRMDNNIYLLDKYSANDLEKRYKLYKYFNLAHIDANIKDLDFSDDITVPLQNNKSINVKLNKEYLFSDTAEYSSKLGEYSMDDQELTVLANTKYGTIYTIKNYIGRLKTSVFIIKTKDGKILPYDGDEDFLNNINQSKLKLNNGDTLDLSMYSLDYQGACESDVPYFNYMYSLKVNDLESIGKVNGEYIYIIKDKNSQVLKSIYNTIFVSFKNAVTDKYKSVKSIDDYLNNYKYNHLFWIDQIGRIIPITNDDIYSFGGCGGKPVIYLYPTKTENVSVNVNLDGNFSKTIPEYNNGWNVKATTSSKITNLSDGKVYPYLFWEGGIKNYKMPENGFVVKQEDVSNLLSEKLSLFGLNTKEISDFKEFWLPRMNGSKYYFITFTSTEEMNKLAPLNISPNPDSVIRVLMDFKPLNEYKEVTPLKIQKTERKGFAVVEWGGILK